MMQFLEGKGFTWMIMSLYALRLVSYAVTDNWARAMYWACALGITVSAEFLIRK